MFAPRDDDAADGDTFFLGHGLGDNPIGFDALFSRVDEVRRIPIERIDLFALDESLEIENLAALDADRVKLFGGQSDIGGLFNFISPHQVASLDLFPCRLVDEALVY